MDRRIIIGVLLAYMLGLTPAYAANECDPVFVGDCAGVNSSATGGGLHKSEYGFDNKIPYGRFTGQKVSYTASIDGPLDGAASANLFSICGSSIKTVRVMNFGLNATLATTAARLPVRLFISKTQPTGGTTLAPTPLMVQHDTKYGPIASVAALNVYIAAPTAASILDIGGIGSRVSNHPITATFVVTNKYEMDVIGLDSDIGEDEPVILRGPTQCMMGSIPGIGTVPTYSFFVQWVEEDDVVKR